MALSEAAKEAVHLKSILQHLTEDDNCVVLFNDNMGALKLSANHIINKRSKHIDVIYHYIREVVASNKILLKYLPTAEMPADVLTKSLCKIKHVDLCRKLGILRCNFKLSLSGDVEYC